MTVEQLIEKLREFPPYREVKIDTRWVVSAKESETNLGPVVTFVTA